MTTSTSIYTSILTLGLLLTLTAIPFAASASGSHLSEQPPDASSLYRGSGR